MTPDELRKLPLNPDDVEKTGFRRELHQQIEVAVGPRVAARHGAENPDVPGAVLRGEVENRLPMATE